MHALIYERKTLGESPTTKELARHMFARMDCGKIVIVAEKPASTLSALRKQWIMLTAKVRRERSSTINAALVYELSRTIVRMEGLRFTSKWPDDDRPADVYIATVEQLLEWPPEQSCKTLYVMERVTREQLHLVTSWMRDGAVVVEGVAPSSDGND